MKKLLILTLFAAWAARAETPLPPLPPLETVLPHPVDEQELFAGWPTAEDVVAAAMQALPSIVRRSHTWRSRQHLAPLFPTVRLAHSVGERNYDRYLLERDPQDRNRLDDYTLEDGVRDYDTDAVWIQWDLSRIMFHNDELEIADVERRLSDFRLRLREDTLRAYYGMKEATLVLAQNVVTLPEERARLKTNVAHNRSLLDMYTDGYFSQHAPRKAP